MKEKDLWINPKSNMTGTDGNRAWNYKAKMPPNSGARFLEFADIALGNKKPERKKKETVAIDSLQRHK